MSGDSTRALVARLWRDWMRPHLPRLILAALLMAVVAAASASYPKIIELAVDKLKLGDQDVFYVMPAAVIVVTFIRGMANYGQSVVSQSVALRIINEIQKAVFAHLVDHDLSTFQSTSTGKLISRFTNDVDMMRAALAKSLTGMVRDALTAAALVGVLFYMDWRLALIVVVLIPLAAHPVIRIGRRLRRGSANAQAEMGVLTANLDQAFSGIRLIKSFRMEAYESRRADAMFDNIYQLTMKLVRGRARTYPFLETLGGVSAAAVLVYGGWRIISGSGTLGEFSGFLAAVIMLYQPIRSLGALNASLQEGLAAVKRTFDLLDTPARIVDRPDAVALPPSRGSIAFDYVFFSYEDGTVALDNISLAVAPGQKVALVGPSGAGKSTLFNLILRFYDVTGGAVTIDGHDVRNVTLASLRANIALVSQDVVLFDDSVAANIGFGKPDATRDEIEAAARDAAAHEFIAALPQGYDTLVGEKGVKLSGGERQRIAIARAMLKDAPILLLDEATSALDAESEAQVQAALDRLSQGRTTLVIAHRLATVRGADVIYVLDRGRIAESGTHGELAARDGLFAKLSRLQFRETNADNPSPLRAQA